MFKYQEIYKFSVMLGMIAVQSFEQTLPYSPSLKKLVVIMLMQLERIQRSSFLQGEDQCLI